MKKVLLALMALAIIAVHSAARADDAADDQGKTLTVSGTLVDTKCYLEGGDVSNDHGSMKACGVACLKSGIPAGVLTSDKKLYILIFSSEPFAKYAGQSVEVTGTLYGDGNLVPTKASVVGKDGKKAIKLKGMAMM
jgi:hypothetical protein